MARRYKSLHHNLQEGENVVFHREHRSPRNRSPVKKEKLQKYSKSSRHKWKNFSKSKEFLDPDGKNWGKRRVY